MAEQPHTLEIYEDASRGFITFAGRQVSPHRIATQTGLNYTYLHRIFRGKRQPSLAYARRLSEVLGMTVDDFLEEVDRLRSDLD